MPVKKKHFNKKNSKKRGQEPLRFPGLIFRLILLGILSLPLALIYIVPLPTGVKLKRPPFEDFTNAPKYIKPHSIKKEPPESPLVAIVIDDMGYDMKLDKAFIMMDTPLSFAFLPYAPFTKKLATIAALRGKDVLVHLPMEPVDKGLNPGPGLLSLDMDFDELIATLKKDINAVPYAIGVNNHMGSLFTANRKKMEIVLAFLKQKGLFFIDSRTTKSTVAFSVAMQMGVPCGERAVFLDHSIKKSDIKRQLKRLLRLSKERGEVIAIGHPHKNTFDALYEELPRLKKYIKIVPVHRIVH